MLGKNENHEDIVTEEKNRKSLFTLKLLATWSQGRKLAVFQNLGYD